MGDESKRIGVTVPVEVWQKFRSKCFWDLISMQEFLEEKILEYIKEKNDEKDVV
ncbi:hypothetical protein KAR91_04685 [Candidatus Pacearchaeota archaeon]|nr:hypothetical protein [Candidatus Pacearchaeota archaeon]